MEKSYAVTRLGSLVLLSGLIVTLVVSPWNSVDPMNLPKMSSLGLFASACVGFLIHQVKKFYKNGGKSLLILVIATQIQMFLVLILVKGEIGFKLYGTPNRNTGFLTYSSLNILLLSAAVASTGELIRRAAKYLVVLGAILSTYGLAQSRGYEFFPYINVYGSNVFGTFGNTNFQSAFMGITGSVIFALVFFKKCTIKFRIALIAALILCLYNIYLTSQQGYLSFAAGSMTTILIYLYSQRKVLFLGLVSFISILGAVLVVFAIFNLGPFSKLIFQSSLQARNFYWNAALKMILEHPFYGVGFDGFGDLYYRFRAESAVQLTNNSSTDTAHSVPLDIGTNGGFVLLFLYLGIVFLTVVSIGKILKRTQDFNVTLVSLVSGWVAYEVQSLISINQIGVGVWGWIISGLIIGYEINTRISDSPGVKAKISGSHKSLAELAPKEIVAVVASIAIGLAVFAPPYIAAGRYYKVLQSGNYELLTSGSSLWPYERTRFFYSAQILIQNGKEEEGIQILRKAVLLYPDYFQLWGLWATTPIATPTEVAKANTEMKRLDPYNPDLK